MKELPNHHRVKVANWTALVVVEAAVDAVDVGIGAADTGNGAGNGAGVGAGVDAGVGAGVDDEVAANLCGWCFSVGVDVAVWCQS